jgi:hypothetical protein
MYASLFGISGALHLDVLEQPEQHVFFSNLPVLRRDTALAGLRRQTWI